MEKKDVAHFKQSNECMEKNNVQMDKVYCTIKNKEMNVWIRYMAQLKK